MKKKFQTKNKHTHTTKMNPMNAQCFEHYIFNARDFAFKLK